MNGKNKCKILKEIRQKIASENDIPFVTAECKYQGDCTGTCPKCEEELVYLENELLKRKKAGKKIVLTGLATAAVILALQSCDAIKDAIDDLEDMQTKGFVSPVSAIDLVERD